MNILIVCNHFYPHNRIAAFRLNAFARYFREAGHSVTVITEGDRDETAMWNGCEVHYVKDPVITSSKQDSLLQRRKKWAFRRILSALQFRLFLDYKRIWQFKACKKARKLAKSRRFDVVLSSYGHLSSHRIAYRLHRKMPFYWIADMRDEMSKWPWLLPINSRRLLFYERRILKDADLILSVSAPLVEDFKQIGGGIDKVIEITNGYDYEEVHDVSFQPAYTMAFIGHFYNSITPDKCSSLLRTGRRGSASLRQPHPHHRKHLAAGHSRKHQPERIPDPAGRSRRSHQEIAGDRHAGRRASQGTERRLHG